MTSTVTRMFCPGLSDVVVSSLLKSWDDKNGVMKSEQHALFYGSGPIFSYKLRYIVGFWLVETAVSTNQKPTMYRNLYENTGSVIAIRSWWWPPILTYMAYSFHRYGLLFSPIWPTIFTDGLVFSSYGLLISPIWPTIFTDIAYYFHR